MQSRNVDLENFLIDAGVNYRPFYGVPKEELPLALEIVGKYLAQGEPQNVDKTDFGLKDKAKNLAAFVKLSKKQGVPREVYGKYTLYQFPTKFALLDFEAHKVGYLVEFVSKPVMGKRSVTQIKLWRDLLDPDTDLKVNGSRVTNNVFFNYLLKTHDCILTDSMQTQFGKEFWEGRLGIAFKEGFPVYYLDLNQKTATRINNADQLVELDKQFHIWSDMHSSMAKRIAICNSAWWG